MNNKFHRPPIPELCPSPSPTLPLFPFRTSGFSGVRIGQSAIRCSVDLQLWHLFGKGP